MFNSQTLGSLTPGKQAERQGTPKLQTTSPILNLPKSAQGDKAKTIGGKSTSIAAFDKSTTQQDIPKTGMNEPAPLQPQGGGGKLTSNKADHEVGQGNIIDGRLQTDKEVNKDQDKKISPLAKFKDDLFFYSKIKNNTLLEKDTERIVNSFQFLTSSEKERAKYLSSLQSQKQREELLKDKIPCLRNEKANVKSWGNQFFSLIIRQLMHENSYLSFKGAFDLLLKYLAMNNDIFFPSQKFNSQFIIKQCNIRIVRQISSSLKSEPYFKKVVKEISYLKDLIFNEYSRFVKILQSSEKGNIQKIKYLNSTQFLTSLGRAIWQNFKHILDSQKKEIKSHYELNCMLVNLHILLKLCPNIFDQKILRESIIPTLRNNFKLIESSKRIKINLIDEIYLHLMLVHPLKSINKHYFEDTLSRYDYLEYFADDQKRLNPMESAATAVFIENVLERNNKFDQFEPQEQYFIFNSIANILKDNPQKFWRERHAYKNIQEYIWHLESIIQDYAEEDDQEQYKEYYNGYYQCMCKLAKILNILCFLPYSHNISPEKLVRNKFIIRQFLVKSFQMIKMKPECLQKLNTSLSYLNLSLEPIYQFWHRLIIADPNEYLRFKAEILREMPTDKIKFQREIFGNYLRQYSQYGQSTATCILAMTKLIEGRYSSEVSGIMDHLQQLEKSHFYQVAESRRSVSQLSVIISCLLNKSCNYLPLAKIILSILRYQPHLSDHVWMQMLLNEFKDLPEKYHPESISQYAIILQACLKFIQHSPKSMMKVQQFFNFKFANRYLCHILEVSFENKLIYNKYMVTACYDKVEIAVRLLKAMTEIYLKEKDSNLGELVPYEIRKLLQSQNKDGNYQIIMRNTAISYHLALITLLLSRQIKFDEDLHLLYPKLKNEILETLINLNYINLELKHENAFKITILYNKQQEDEINKAINLKSDLFETIIKDPTYLGLQYLISSGTVDLKQKKSMFQKLKEIETDQSTLNMKYLSHFVIVYWNEIQNSKLNIDSLRGWQYAKREICLITQALNAQHMQLEISLQDKQNIDEILKNIYSFSNLLKNCNKDIYIDFVIKFYLTFMNCNLNSSFILSEDTQSNSANPYHSSLLTFFSCKTFVSNQLFQKIIKQNVISCQLNTFLMQLIKLTYKRSYKVHNDSAILDILEFGLTFLIELEDPNPQRLKEWLNQIKREFVNRPQRNTPILTKEIIILILLYSKTSDNIACQDIEFGNKSWILMMNSAENNVRYSSILISELFNIYQTHPIFFASTCHYLAQTAKTRQMEFLYEVNHYKTRRQTVAILIDILKKSIQAQRSYHSIWIIEVLIEIYTNRTINQNIREKFCSDIRSNVLTLSLMHERIAELLAKIGSFYSHSYNDLWITKKSNLTVESQITFSEKQQLLAYFRIITLLYFSDKAEKQGMLADSSKIFECENIQSRISQKFLNLIHLISDLLRDEKKSLIKANNGWQQKAIIFDLTQIESSSIKSSGIKQLTSQKIGEIWKDRNALSMLDEVTNIELTSICALWVTKLRQSQLQDNTIIFENIEKLQFYLQKLLRLMEVIKKKFVFITENSKDIDVILSFINKNIYQGSIEVSRQLMMTNMPSLSSALNLNYQQILENLWQTFTFVYCLTMEILTICSENRFKIDQKLIKMAYHLYRSCSSSQTIGKKFNSAGSRFGPPPGYENSRNDTTYTKSRTVWSQR